MTAFLSGYTAHGRWFEWVSDWWKEKLNFPTQIHWIQFEHVKTHPKEEIKQLALFLNIHSIRNSELDKLVDKVYELSTFDSMKIQVDQKIEKDGIQHMRKGTRGDWKRHFDILSESTDEIIVDGKQHNNADGSNDVTDATEAGELQYLKNRFFELFQEHCHWTGLEYEYDVDEATGEVFKFK